MKHGFIFSKEGRKAEIRDQRSEIRDQRIPVFLLSLAIACFGASEPINVNSLDGKVKQTSSGVGAVGKPFNFTDVFVTGLAAGAGTVTHTTGALTLNQLVIGNAADDIKPLGSLGTTTTVLHGNAAGAPTFGPVSLTLDVTGDLPFANIAQIATDSILGRATTATGDIEVLAALPFAFTGEVTRPADSNVQTITNDAVTYAKMQNVSAASKLLGRGSAAGAGDIEEITVGSGLSMTGTTLSVTAGGGTVTQIDVDSPIIASPDPITGAGTLSLNVGVDHAFTALQTVTVSDAGTNTHIDGLAIYRNTTGTPANGLGVNLVLGAESSTTTSRQQGRIQTFWSDVTDATRTATMSLDVVNNGNQQQRLFLFGAGGASVDTDVNPGIGQVNALNGFKVNNVALNFSHLAGDFALTQTPSAAADKLIGRGNGGGAGDWQEITLGTNLSITGTTLNATGGGSQTPWTANIDADGFSLLVDDATGIKSSEAGNPELLLFTSVASAVNEAGITNAASGNPPIVGATGDDTNIDVGIRPKGTGWTSIYSNVSGGAMPDNGSGLAIGWNKSGGSGEVDFVNEYNSGGGGTDLFRFYRYDGTSMASINYDGIVNVLAGFRIGGAAATGAVMIGGGTNFTGDTTPTLVDVLTLATGTTSIAPANYPAGTLKTTPADGDREVDADAMYGTTDAGNRGYIPIRHVIRADATRTFTSNTSEQAIFTTPTNGRITLETGTYRFTAVLNINTMSATSGNGAIDPLGAGTATVAAWNWTACGSDSAAGVPTASGCSHHITQQSGTDIVVAATGATLGVTITGTCEVTGAGTMIPSFTMTTAAASVLQIGSYWTFERIGSTSMTTVGQWD